MVPWPLPLAFLVPFSSPSELTPQDRIVFQDTFDDLSPCGWGIVKGKGTPIEGKTCDGAGALSLGSDAGKMTARRKVDFAVSENTYLCFGYGHCTACELNVCLASADGTESVSRAAIAAYGWWKPRTTHVLTGFEPRLAAGTKVTSLRLSFAKPGGSIIVDNVTILEAHDLYALGELMPAPCQVKNPLKITLPEDLKHPVASNYWVRRCMYGRRGKPPPADEVVKRAGEFLDRHDGEEIQIPRGVRECGVADGKCPAHADVALSFDPAKPGRLHCPECEKDYEGGQYHNDGGGGVRSPFTI